MTFLVLIGCFLNLDNFAFSHHHECVFRDGTWQARTQGGGGGSLGANEPPFEMSFEKK